MARLVDAAQQLTDQRTNRLFVGSFSGQLAASDQSAAGYDDGVCTPAGQYQVRGQYGYATEGQPQSDAQQQQTTKRRLPVLALVLAAAAVYWVIKK